VSLFHEPVHSSQDVLFCGLAHGVLLIVGEYYHVFAPVAKVFDQVSRHVSDVVDAAAQLAALAKIVDADQKCFPPTRALRVLEGIALRRPKPKVLGRMRRRGRGLVVSVHI
jgi:hypothetical protein